MLIGFLDLSEARFGFTHGAGVVNDGGGIITGSGFAEPPGLVDKCGWEFGEFGDPPPDKFAHRKIACIREGMLYARGNCPDVSQRRNSMKLHRSSALQIRKIRCLIPACL